MAGTGRYAENNDRSTGDRVCLSPFTIDHGNARVARVRRTNVREEITDVDWPCTRIMHGDDSLRESCALAVDPVYSEALGRASSVLSYPCRRKTKRRKNVVHRCSVLSRVRNKKPRTNITAYVTSRFIFAINFVCEAAAQTGHV